MQEHHRSPGVLQPSSCCHFGVQGSLPVSSISDSIEAQFVEKPKTIGRALRLRTAIDVSPCGLQSILLYRNLGNCGERVRDGRPTAPSVGYLLPFDTARTRQVTRIVQGAALLLRAGTCG